MTNLAMFLLCLARDGIRVTVVRPSIGDKHIKIKFLYPDGCYVNGDNLREILGTLDESLGDVNIYPICSKNLRLEISLTKELGQDDLDYYFGKKEKSKELEKE